jgi:hypothetical protein
MIAVVVVGAIYLLIADGTKQTAVPVITAQPATATPSPSETPSVEPSSAAPSAEPTPTASRSASATPRHSPSPTPAAAKLTRDNLPKAGDMEWLRPGDWLVAGTRTGLGEQPVGACVADDLGSYDGTKTVLRRDFTLPDNGRGTAVALSYDTAQAASASFETISQAAAGCRSALQHAGFTHLAPVKRYVVSIPEGITGTFYETSYRAQGQDQNYESVGLALAGTRVLVLTMIVVEPDSHWAYAEESDKPLHPMFRSLPRAAVRLVS